MWHELIAQHGQAILGHARRETPRNKPMKTMKIEQDAIGRTIRIIGTIMPSTPEEDRLEMLRLWDNPRGVTYDPRQALRASGGAYPINHPASIRWQGGKGGA